MSQAASPNFLCKQGVENNHPKHSKLSDVSPSCSVLGPVPGLPRSCSYPTPSGGIPTQTLVMSEEEKGGGNHKEQDFCGLLID